MTRLRVLITNNSLAVRGGSEVFLRDLAIALLRRGHHPVVYSSIIGDTAQDLRMATVPVVTDLDALGDVPDVIHGQHHLETMTAALRFPTVPALFICHGWLPWEEMPPVLPSIRQYVAVDDLCRDRLLTTRGISADRVHTIYNAVDLTRYRPRAPLPRDPRSALVFSNYAHEGTSIAMIREACRTRGIERVDVVGAGVGRAAALPETILPDYDVVFAKARCALEAMAVGCAVILTDLTGFAGYVTPANVQSLRRLNFGVRTMQAEMLTVEGIGRALDQYDALASADVGDWIRKDADLTASVLTFERLYQALRSEGSPWSAATAAEFSNRTSEYLRSLAPLLKGRHDAEARAHDAEVRANAVGGDAHAAEARAALTEAMRDAATTERDHLAKAFGEIQRSKAWRLISAYRSTRKRLGL